jgi:hypothetical protein
MLSGMNENYLIEHNRFETSQEGIVCKGVNFDHVIRGNVFVLRSGGRVAVKFEGGSGRGVVVTDNRVFGGSASIVAGGSGVTAERNTRAARPAKLPPRPQPDVPSIYEWQLKRRSPAGRKPGVSKRSPRPRTRR